MVKVGLALPGIDVRVVTPLASHLFTILQGKGVVAIGAQIGSIHRELGAPTQLLPPAQRGGDKAKRTALQTGTERRCATFGKVGFLRFDTEHTSRGVEAGRLQHILVLPHSQGEHLHIIERKTTDINLSAQTVAYGHAVVAHSRMGGTHVAHRDGLQSAYAAIVLHIGPGKSAHGVSQILQT